MYKKKLCNLVNKRYKKIGLNTLQWLNIMLQATLEDNFDVRFNSAIFTTNKLAGLLAEHPTRMSRI